ncbi:hypothetical protein GGI20_001098 [Coemansia sp. BCRC 34301]|nr:hypothetical protein GGI20_001098 [Coemansia sp. BCRC 34301]
MAARPIVSYDDLYSGDEAESAALLDQQQQQQKRPRSASSHTSLEDNSELCAGDIIAQPDAWNDAELVRAWDSTIEDYRKHHASILGDSAFREAMRETESKPGQWSSVTKETSVVEATSSKKRRHSLDASQRVTAPGYEASEAGQDYIGALPAYPEAPLTEEDALNKLNMAWYHAGFYAGYYQRLK